MSAMRLVNVNYSLVIRINSADPNSFMTRVSALSRYDPNKHGFTMYFLRLCVGNVLFKSGVIINCRKSNVGLFAHKNLPVLLLPLNCDKHRASSDFCTTLWRLFLFTSCTECLKWMYSVG